MKLRTLTIHNIASIAHADIDFDGAPLDRADVFLISGDTGAGKSTILDAICLSLFGTVPRMTGLRGGDRYDEISFTDERQLLRAGTGEGFARLTFRGNDGHEYDCRWAVRRSRNKPDGKFQKAERYLLVDGDAAGALTKTKEVSAAVEAAVGVGYEQFVRTSMLAQGEFTRFLKADDREKSEILEKLTGTGLYKEIGAEIFRRTSECRKVVDDLQLKIDSANLLSEEEKSALIAESKALEVAIEEDRRQSKILNERLGQLRRRDAMVLALERSKVALDKARAAAEADSVASDKQILADYGTTALARENLHALRAAVSDYNDSVSALSGLRTSFGSILALKDKAQAEQQRLERVLDLLGSYLRCPWRGEPSEIDKACKALGRIDVLKSGEASFGFLEALRGEDNPGLSVAEAGAALSARQAILGRLNTLKGLKERCNAELATAERQQKERKEAEAEAAKEASELERATAVAKTLADVAATSRRLCSEMEMAGKEWAKKARASLVPGCTCPVCMQKVSEMPPVEEELTAIWRSLRERADGDALASSRAAAEVASHKALQSAALKRAEQLTENIRQGAANIEKLQEAVRAARVDSGISEDENIDTAIEACRKDVEAAEYSFMCASLTDAVRDKYVSCRQTVAEKKVHCDNLVRLVDSVVNLLPEWEGVDQAAGLSGKAPSPSDFEASVRSQFDRRTRAQLTVDRLKQLVDEFLAATPEISAERLKSLASMTSESIEAIRRRLNAIAENFARAEAAYAENKKQLAELMSLTEKDPDADTLQTQLDALTERNGVNTRRYGAIGEILDRNAKTEAQLAVMLTELSEAREVWMKWKRLDDLLGSATGDRFNRIAQSFVLKSLLEKANVYLSRLTGRYRLRGVDGTYLILLEDAYAGFRQRPVVTSSGGESFMVSLALALALADAGSSFCCDTLFIDEGFGTLSGEPLQKAVALLRTLYHRSGRRVGIISHVAELKNDIAVQIHVTRNPVDEVASVEVKEGWHE